MSIPTQGDAITLVAALLGLNPEDAVGAVMILAMKDGQVGISSTGHCECGTLQMMSRAIERISGALHQGESPFGHEGEQP